jgi:hypothetical protein
MAGLIRSTVVRQLLRRTRDPQGLAYNFICFAPSTMDGINQPVYQQRNRSLPPLSRAVLTQINDL